MKGSKEKNLKISNPNCFSSILKNITCGGNLPSPTPSDHHHHHHHHHHHILPKFKSNGYIYPNPNELPKSEPTSTNPHFPDQNESFEADFAEDDNPRQPGLVARLMGLESMPNYQDSIVNLRSKSLNSLHLYIFPDTFLDHVSPSPQFSSHQRPKPCHRRAQSTSPILCVEPSSSKEKIEPYTCNVEDGVVSKPEKRRRNGELSTRKKVDQENESKTSKKNDRKKALENKVDATKCRASEEQRTQKRISQRDDPRKEIVYKGFGTKLRKERGVCRIRNADELKIKVDEKAHRHHASVYDHRRDSKDDSAVRPRRRRSSRKIMTDQQIDNQKQNSRYCFQGKKLCSKAREDTEDCNELMAQVMRLTEEEYATVEDYEWINFNENVKEFGVDFAGEMLLVLMNQFLDELLR